MLAFAGLLQEEITSTAHASCNKFSLPYPWKNETVKGKMDTNGYPFREFKRSLSVRTPKKIHSKHLISRSNGLYIRSNGSLIRSNVSCMRSNGSDIHSNGYCICSKTTGFCSKNCCVPTAVRTVLTSILDIFV